MKIYFGIISLMFIFFNACQLQEGNKYSSVNGTWKSLGSGYVMEISDSTSYAIFDVTSISCLPNWKGGFEEIEASIVLRNDTITLQEGTMTFEFIRTKKLPVLCMQQMSEAETKDPMYNFEVFAETIKEHYAFIELNEIDWNELYSRQKAKLIANSTEAQLFLLLDETLEELNDNHAFLEATDEVYEAVDKILVHEEENNPEDDELEEYGDFPIAAMVAEHHIQEEMTEDSWLIQWGKMTDEIGFIQIKAMWLYADLDIPQKLIDEFGFVGAYVETFHKMYEGDYVKKEVQAAAKIFDKVMLDLSPMKSIVIDVRFNGGGQDAISYEMLSRFTPQKIQVGIEKIRYGNQFTNSFPIYIQGTQDAYTKPVYILTSKQTGSAAECFSIASMELPNVKRIGSSTAGALSTSLEKTLPNGWDFALSNQMYMDNEGVAYENIGIPVDYTLDYSEDRQTFFRSVAKDLVQDKVDILKAIEKLSEGK